MGFREFLGLAPREKAVTASPEVLETMAARQFSAFPLIATPNTGDQMRVAFEAMVSGSYGYLYKTQPSVRSVVDFIARNICQLALRLYERTSDIERHEASDHPAAAAMRNPNAQTPGQQFIFDLLRDLLVYENAYVLKSRVNVNAPLVLTQLPPARTSVLGPSYFQVDRYRVYNRDGTFLDFDPGDIIHWRGATNPDDPRLGLSKLETLRQVLAEDAASQAANVELLKAGLSKPGYVKRPLDAPEWSDEGMDRFREAWMNALKESARKTPVLEEGMSFEDFGITPKDAQMIDGRRFTIEESCRMYGLPKGLMSIDPTPEDREALYADVLPPLCELFCSYLDVSVLQAEYDATKHYFEFDLDEKLQGDNRLMALTSAAGGPVMTRNEARAKLNLPPQDGGDELITPMNVTVGGKPSPRVMPIQDPNGPLQDGSQRNASINGNGKALYLPRQEGQRQRRAHYAGEFEGVLHDFFVHHERSMRSKGGKAVDWKALAKDLSGRLLRLMRIVVAREGGIAGASFGSSFDLGQVENYLAATASGKAEEVITDLQQAFAGDSPADVFATAKDVRAPGIGNTLATQMTNFAHTEAAKQTPDASHRLKTWIVTAGPEKSAHWEMNGETVPLTSRFSNGKEYPPFEHPGCECLVSVT